MMRSEWVSCSFGDGYGAALLVKAAQNNNEELFGLGTTPWGHNVGDTPRWGHHLGDNAIKRNRLIKNKKVSNEPIISLGNVEQVNLILHTCNEEWSVAIHTPSRSHIHKCPTYGANNWVIGRQSGVRVVC